MPLRIEETAMSTTTGPDDDFPVEDDEVDGEAVPDDEDDEVDEGGDDVPYPDGADEVGEH